MYRYCFNVLHYIIYTQIYHNIVLDTLILEEKCIFKFYTK